MPILHFRFEDAGTTHKVYGRITQRDVQLRAGRRALIEKLGLDLQERLRDEAPKKTGLFAAGIRATPSTNFFGETTLHVVSEGEHARVGSGIPGTSLLTLIYKGTRPHPIPRGGAAEQLAKGYPLSFWWERGPRGPGLYHYWAVNHPGTQPNPFPDRVLRQWLPKAEQELANLGLAVGRITHYYH